MLKRLTNITPQKSFIVLVLAFIALAFTNGVPFIYSDGYASFHTASSIVDYHSWVSPEKPEHYDYKGHVIDQMGDGSFNVVYPPGTAVFNVPGQFIAKQFEGEKTIYNDYYKATNGHTLAEGVAFLVTANIFGLLTIYLLYKICFEITASQKVSILLTFAAYFSSYAIWYVMLNPSFNHTYELFGVSLAVYAFIKYLKTKTYTFPSNIALQSNSAKTLRQAQDKLWLRLNRADWFIFLTGAGVGIATLSRPVLLIIGIPVGLYFLLEIFRIILRSTPSPIPDPNPGPSPSPDSLLTKAPSEDDLLAPAQVQAYSGKSITQNAKLKTLLINLKYLIVYGLGGLPFAILLCWYNFVSYGKLIASGYDEVRGETFQFEEFNGLKVLFSFERGWFVYSPIFLIGVVGLILLFRQTRDKFNNNNTFLGFWSLFSIISLVTIYGFWPSWWAGGSYGHRFMLPLLPFGVIGLGSLINLVKTYNVKPITYNKLSRFITFILIMTTLWSLTLTLMYRFTPVAELKPTTDFVESGGRVMYSGDRYTPYDMFKYQFDLLKDSSGPTNYISNLIDSGNGGNSIIPILLGQGNTTLRIDEQIPGTLTFKVIEPPKRVYDIPMFIDLYIKDTASGLVSKITLRGAANGSSYTFVYSAFCFPTDSNILINCNISNYPKELSKDEYVGLSANNNQLQIYFFKADKLFFKGSPINLPDGVQNYSI